MISIKKCENVSEIGFKPPLEAYVLFDEGILKLACIFEIHKSSAKILDLKEFADVSKLYYDAIIKTVAAYSLSLGVERMVSSNENIADALTSVGFVKEKGVLCAKSALLVTHQCGEVK